MKTRRTDTGNTILRKDPEIGGRCPRLRNDHKTSVSASGLRNEGKTGVQPTTSKKDKTVDPAPTMFKSTDKADFESAKELPLNRRDQKRSKMCDRMVVRIKDHLIRQRGLIERLERKERKRLEDIEW